MNEYSLFSPITLTFFEVSNTFFNRYWNGNVSNGVTLIVTWNTFDTYNNVNI